MSHPLLGYFDSPEQTDPTYDPPHDGPCIVCMQPITENTVRTVSLWGRGRSWFYRLHRACGDAMTDDERRAIDHSILHFESES